MAKSKFSLNYKDDFLSELMEKADHKTLAIWAKACAERVTHYFEAYSTEDTRPHEALKTLQAWIDTGEFKMAVIRKASLDSHAAARDVGEDNPARSAARAAGQAVATAHVRTHAPGASLYGLQAIHRASIAADVNADSAITTEREWQTQHLLNLLEK